MRRALALLVVFWLAFGLLSPLGAQQPLTGSGVVVDLTFSMDGGGSPLTTSSCSYAKPGCWQPVDFPCTIAGYTMFVAPSGSIVVNVAKTTYAASDGGATHPAVGDKITASAPPTISSGTKATDSTLTGWTRAISAGDILALNIDSVSTVTSATLVLKCLR